MSNATTGFAGSDDDGDGYSTAVETYMGTDPTTPCALTIGANDETSPGWPPDFNNDAKVDLLDVVAIRAKYGHDTGDPLYSARYDLNADGKVNLQDIVLMRNSFGQSCTPQLPVTLGSFVGQYYNNSDLTALTFVRRDTAINFNWGSASPGPLLGADTFSVRWTGDFAFSAGVYTFTANVDDGLRIWIDGSQVINQWQSHSSAVVFQRTLTTGTHRIVMEYYENTGSAKAQLGWAADAADDTRVAWEGGEWYLHGVNMPWYNWACDFGCGSGSGASATSVRADISSKFAQLQTAGVHVVRWWTFPGDPWQVQRSGIGAPTGIDSQVYADFDAALELAEQYDLYYNFTLFSSPADIPRTWLESSTQRTALANALGQLFAHYGSNPRILSWQVFNEPEWSIWNNERTQLSVQQTVQAIATSVHANSNAYVSVGAAMLDGLPMWTGLGLDYYTAHWYDYMSSGAWCARCTDYEEVQERYNLDAPLVIGEFYAGPETDALDRFEDFYDKGYAGAWAWSLFSTHTGDGLQVDLNAAQTFSASRSDIGP